MATTQPVGHRIPVPPDFPVEWDDPSQEHLFWTRERMHYPEPVKPVIESLDPEAGLNFAAATYDLPIRYHARVINTYRYTAVSPVTMDPEELAAIGERAMENVRHVLARFGEVWETEMLPEIKEHLAYWDSFDLRGATTTELLVHFDETVRRFRRLWDIHFMVGLPMLLSMSLFDDFYRDLFGNQSAFDAFRLLQGFDNKTLETDRALWQLSRKALALPAVQRILQEQAAADVVPALEQSPECADFLAELRAYLDEYGQRCATSGGNVFDPAEPSWIENPAPVIKNLKDYITQPDRDLEAEMAKQAAERERALAETRERLRGYPQPVVGQFEALLKAAQDGVVLSENHDFWIDFRGSYRIRRVLVELGRRLAGAGAVDSPDDVFYLKFDEIREALAALPGTDRRELVARRKAEMAHFRTITPPPALGTMPPGPPPDDAAGRTLIKFFGGPPQPPTEPGVLRGSPGSPGKVSGTAKIVRSLAEAAKLEPGDIMIAETTAPPWTPLFATVAAVVTETGGILSHCAVVAREYGIPAVVGAAMATTMIEDGQTVEVDGDSGTVRVITAA